MKLKNEYIGDITYAEYDEIPAVRSTFLKKILHCPRNVLRSTKDTSDMFFGRAFHDYFLRPETFSELYPIAKPCHERFLKGKYEGKRCGAPGVAYDGHTFWYCSQHRGNLKKYNGFILQQEDLKTIKCMVDSIHEHPTARQLFDLGGKAEQAITWQDPETGLWCKAMIDYLPEFTPLETNIKTAKSANNYTFWRQCEKMHYHLSSAMALEGLSRVTKQEYNLANYVVIEKEWPYRIAVYDLPEDGIRTSREDGNQLFHECLAKYKSCLDTRAEFIRAGLSAENATRKAFPPFINGGSSYLGEAYIQKEYF